MKSINELVIGLILVLLGVSFLFGIGNFWPVVLIAIGAVVGSKRNYTAAFILVTLGVLFLISDVYNVNVFSVFWPLVIVSIGLSMLLKSLLNTKSISGGGDASRVVNDTALFAGIDRKITSDEFEGGTLSAIFGGIKIDLRKAKVSPKGAVLHVSAVFGGAEIIVPDNIKVESVGTPIFGGWDNKYMNEPKHDSPVLKIDGSVIFGGVEVKN